MKKQRYADWAKLADACKPKPDRPPIRMLDLPGFEDLERKLLLFPPLRSGVLPLGIDSIVDELSRQTFGATESETRFDLPSHYHYLPKCSEERDRIDRAYENYEDRFETTDLTDDETVVVLLRLGLDFRDRRGLPLRCTKLFSRQVEAASRGIAGKMPDASSLGLELWESKLGRDAQAFMASRGRNRKSA